jgi:cell wall-associated NlpC family hydrolase
MIHYKQKMLEQGKTFETSEKGNSMTPLIKSGQKHILTPIAIENVQVGDIVFCKVRGSYYTHLVTAIGDKGLQISNNHGHINGWTRQVFGKVTEIL